MQSSPTIIEFIFIRNFQFQIQNLKVHLKKANILYFFSEGNQIIIPKTILKKDSYVESFEINDKKSNIFLYSFVSTIYEGIINHIYYDNTNNEISPTIEMIFYGKNFLPDEIHYKKIALNIFDNNNNKYRKRLCLANFSPNDLEYINHENFIRNNYIFEEISYQILIRFSTRDDFKYSLSYINYESEENNINFSKEIFIKEDKIELLEKFRDDYLIFLENLEAMNFLEFNNDISKNLSDDLKSLDNDFVKIQADNLFNYSCDPISYQIPKKSLEIIHYSYLVFEYQSISRKGKKIEDFFLYKDFSLQNKLLEETLFEKLNKDKNLGNEDKIKVLKTVSNFCIKSTIAKYAINNIDYINIESIDKANPYFKAIELIKKIIDNLNENSRLFEVFLNFDSGSFMNFLEQNEEIEYIIKDVFNNNIKGEFEKYKTEFGLSLLNLDQIKSHLKSLIPKVIIRIESPIRFRAYYDKETNIMILNEFIMFDNTLNYMNLNFKSDGSVKYIIPITLEILHEMFSHGKIRINNSEDLTPRFYRDSKNNFKYKSILKKCTTNKKEVKLLSVPESGRILENYISENSYVIDVLKTALIENTKFLDIKYWIGSDFTELENEILKLDIDINNINKNSLNDQSDDYEMDDCYIERGNMVII